MAPPSTLHDNGAVYTRFTGGRNAFEYLIPLLGVIQKNAQTIPKARSNASTKPETLLAAATISALQHSTPSRPLQPPSAPPALNRTTPADAYHAPSHTSHNHHQPYRIRYDRIDKTGRITLRRQAPAPPPHRSRPQGTRVLAIADDTPSPPSPWTPAKSGTPSPAQLLAKHAKGPGRWQGPFTLRCLDSSETHVRLITEWS